MKEDMGFEKLKEYLTKEYMKLSDQRDALVEEKIQWEIKKEKEEKPLFDRKDIEKIRRLFSPLSDETYDNRFSTMEKNNEISIKITELEEKLNFCDFSMEEIKEYVSFLQKIEIERKKIDSPKEDKDRDNDFSQREMDEKIEFSEEVIEETLEEESDSETGEEEIQNLTEMIFDTAEFLEQQYPKIQFVVDFEEDDYELDYDRSANLIRIITYVLSSTIESVEINSVEIEIKKEESILLSLKMLYNDKVLSQHSMWIARDV